MGERWEQEQMYEWVQAWMQLYAHLLDVLVLDNVLVLVQMHVCVLVLLLSSCCA